MVVLNNASSVFLGNTPVTAVYVEGNLIWPSSGISSMARTLTPVTITFSPRPLTHSLSNRALTPLTLTLTPVALTRTVGPVTATLTPRVFSLTPVTLVHGAVLNRTLTPVTMTFAPVALTRSVGGAITSISPVTFTFTARPLTGSATQSLVIDNFNRANAPNPGTNWVPQAGMTLDRSPIVGNKIELVGGANGTREQWVGASFVPAGNIEVGFIDSSYQPTPGSDHWLAARWSSNSDSWYGFWFNMAQDQYGIVSVTPTYGFYWVLEPRTGLNFVAGDHWTMKIVGFLIQVYRNGSLFASVTDTFNTIPDSPTNRRFGWLGLNASGSDYIRLEDFEASNVANIGVDLMIEDIIFTTPASFPAPIASFNPGDHVLCGAVVRNQGDTTMPAGTIANNQQLAVAFKVDGNTVTWHDQTQTSLAAGAAITLWANGHPGDAPGANGINYWVATEGSHTITAEVNNPQRKVESNYTNNTRDETLFVSGGTPTGLAHKAYLWGGGADAFSLRYNSHGYTAATLLAKGITGLICIGQGPWWVDDPYDDIFSGLAAAGLKMLVGKYVGSTPDPISAGGRTTQLNDFAYVWGNAAAAGATGCALDAEPYNYGSSLWNDIPAADAAAFGTAIGNLALSFGFNELIMYCSSAASWNGSYNDLVAFQASGNHYFVNNHFANFLYALVDTGIPVTHTDAVFHHGPQLAGYTWDSGAALSVDLCDNFHPNLRGSIMFWPDIDEGGFAPPNNGYPVGTTQDAAKAAYDRSTGPFTIYQHHFSDGTQTSRWNGWLNEIAAGMAAPPPPPSGGAMPTLANTGPNSTNGTITMAQWIAAGTASNKIITGAYSGGADIVGRTLTATDCSFQNQFFYQEPGPQSTPNLPHLILTRCEFLGGWITAGAMNLEIYNCFIEAAYWTPCGSCGGEDHVDNQTNRQYPVICNDTMFHHVINPIVGGFHTEALHLVGGNIGLHFTNTRFAMDGPFTTQTTGAMKATAIDSSWTDCWWDWNGGTPGSFFTIYLEGRNVTVSGGHVQRATRNFSPYSAFNGYYYAYAGFQAPAPWSPAGGGGVNNYVVPPSLNTLRDWYTDAVIVNNQI